MLLENCKLQRYSKAPVQKFNHSKCHLKTSTVCGACRSAKLDAGLILISLYSFFYTSWDMLAGVSWMVCMGVPQWLLANFVHAEMVRAPRCAFRDSTCAITLQLLDVCVTGL